MSEKKPMPKCPYCGAEMSLEDNEDVLFGIFADEEKMYWYQCNTPSCGIHSPAKHTTVGAYIAAMSRWQGPNRVLTLEELKHYNGFIWCESRDGEVFGDDESCVRARMVTYWEGKSHRIYFDGGRTWYADYTYGETWRCWLRKPTPEEMANTPWEEKE